MKLDRRVFLASVSSAALAAPRAGAWPFHAIGGGTAYYVDYLNGNDSNSGLSPAAAWQHGPGDPNAGTIPKNTVPAPGATVYWAGGQDHFLASYNGQTTFLQLSQGGSSLSEQVTHASYGGGQARWRGDEPQPSGWVSATTDPLLNPTGGSGPPASASIAQKLTPSTAGAFFQQFLTVGGVRLYPAQYPVPAVATDWEQVGAGPTSQSPFQQLATTAFNAQVTYSYNAETQIYTITITDTSLLARYGQNNLVGYTIVQRYNGDWTEEDIITAGPDSSGNITFLTLNEPLTPIAGNADYFYAIRYHPRDLELPGQYAWSANGTTGANLATCYGTFGTSGNPYASGTPGITRLGYHVNLGVSHVTFNNLAMLYTTASPSDSNAGAAIYSDATISDINIANCSFTGFQSPQRNAVVSFFEGNPSLINVSYVMFDDSQGRALSIAGGNSDTSDPTGTITNMTAKRMGRTCDYSQYGSYSSSDPATIQTHKYIRVSNCYNIHGPGIAVYGVTHNSQYFNCEAMNHSAPLAAQDGGWAADPTYPRNNHWKGIIATGRRPTPGTNPATGQPWNPLTQNVGRFDGNERGSMMEQILCGYSTSAAGIAFDGGGNTGMTVRNAVFDQLAPVPNALSGMNFENVLLLADFGGGISQGSDLVNTFGATSANNVTVIFNGSTSSTSFTGQISGTTLTVSNLTGIALAKGMPVAGTNVAYGTTLVSGSGTTWTVNISQTVASETMTSNSQWNGTFTAQMQQFLTQVPNGSGNSGVYQQITMGLGWVIPGYGTSYSLADCALDNTTVPIGWSQDEAFASVINTQVDSVLSLPSGVGNNNLFYLDHGQVFFAEQAAAGTYTLNVMQNNPNNPYLSGPTTHTTAITVTVAGT